jgi:hypothetical protein
VGIIAIFSLLKSTLKLYNEILLNDHIQIEMQDKLKLCLVTCHLEVKKVTRIS